MIMCQLDDILFTFSGFQVQVLELEFEDGKFVGMPFVIKNGGNWIKNSGSDFYVDFKVRKKQVYLSSTGIH